MLKRLFLKLLRWLLQPKARALIKSHPEIAKAIDDEIDAVIPDTKEPVPQAIQTKTNEEFRRKEDRIRDIASPRR